MKLLLTGGAGYIGAHTLVELLRAGHRVRVLDDLSTGFREAVARAAALGEGQAELVVADVADAAATRAALRGVDAVIHFAAFKMVGESMEAPERYFRNNLGGMTMLLDAMQAEGVTRLVYSSSAAVYGTQEVVPIREDAPLRPESPYGLSKAQGEGLLDWMARQRGWAAVSLRYFNPVGAHPSGRIGQPPGGVLSLVPRAILAIGGAAPPLSVFGTDYPTPDGTCLRDYIHVVDLALAHLAALSVLERPGHHVFNVGTGRAHSVREVIAACREATGREVPHTEGPRRPGDVVTSLADPTRFTAATGFVAETGLHEMVRSAWAWWEAHPHGYPTA